MLSCNNIILNYAIVIYDKTTSKGKDCVGNCRWATRAASGLIFLMRYIMNTFIKRLFGVLKTNWILYLHGIKHKISEFAFIYGKQVSLSASWPLTGGNIMSTVWENLNGIEGIENAVVLITYQKDVFWVPKALRAFARRVVLHDFTTL